MKKTLKYTIKNNILTCLFLLNTPSLFDELASFMVIIDRRIILKSENKKDT